MAEKILDLHPIKMKSVIPPVELEKNGAKEIYNLQTFEFPNGFPLEQTSDAMLLSSRMNKIMAQRLDNIMDSAPDAEAAKIQSVKNWSYKKSDAHPLEVVDESEKISASPQFYTLFTENGEDMWQIARIAKINAHVHDIGRQCEIDLLNLRTVELSSIRGADNDHAIESFNLLVKAGIKDPRILLPVKYHGMMDYRAALNADPMFSGLADAEKAMVSALVDNLRDSDKRANLIVKAKFGMKGVGELTNPKYRADYDISAATLDGLMNATGCKVGGESHRLDAMLRWLSWGDQLVYKDDSAEYLLSELWDRTFEEANAEFEASEDKDQARLDKTLRQLKLARATQMLRLFGEKKHAINDNVVLTGANAR
ncbi:MAG: hypothetical protein LBL46_01210 [Rickettsiales bacterium]|jgi:hypothetical protein|nr:hypothetical protein [Rickettsiales bacterium]